MTNQQAYEALSNSNVHWDRQDASHIVIWTSGYITADAMNIERFLRQAGMVAMSQDYDSVCGKTKTLYKHK